ncbi:unnamed protein product [Moneuplotes crassus]|uniref:Uncharacterized protein n=1 Tax=Euplotes crassus TaxID=5936 RepID=A0AAD2D9S6_EUPCR|nr:unnamed protein product [Moneuplotes crassus]
MWEARRLRIRNKYRYKRRKFGLKLNKSIELSSEESRKNSFKEDNDYGYMKMISHLPPIKSRKLDLDLKEDRNKKQTKRYNSLIRSDESPFENDSKMLISTYFKTSSGNGRNDAEDKSLSASSSGIKISRLLDKANRVINKYQSIDIRDIPQKTLRMDQDYQDEDYDYGEDYYVPYPKRRQLHYYLKIKQRIKEKKSQLDRESGSRRTSIFAEESDDEESVNTSIAPMKQETIQEVDSSIFGTIFAPNEKKISEVDSRHEASSPSRIQSPKLDVQQMETIDEENRKIIKIFKYINVDEAKSKFTKSLFDPKAPLDLDILTDEKIFIMLQDGLTDKQIQWIKKNRDILIEKAKQKKARMNPLESSHSKSLEEIPSEEMISLNLKQINPSQDFSEFRRSNKLRKVKLKSQDKNIKIICANLEKERLMKEKRFSLEQKLREKEQNSVRFSVENIKHTTDMYITKTFLNVYLRSIDQKFRLKKRVMANTSKLGKRICWILKAVGMFLLKLRNIRIRIAKKKIENFVRRFCRRWLEKRREQKKKILYNFLKYKAVNQGKIELRSLKFYKTITKLQTMVRKFLVRRLLKYCIINYQWNIYEKEYLKAKGALNRIPQSQENKELETQIRKIYIREYLRWQRIRHHKDMILWEKECQEMLHKHNIGLSQVNAHNILAGLPLVNTQPTYPPPPYLKLFIPETKLREMVKEAFEFKPQWENMALGLGRSPLLKKLKNIR